MLTHHGQFAIARVSAGLPGLALATILLAVLAAACSTAADAGPDGTGSVSETRGSTVVARGSPVETVTVRLYLARLEDGQLTIAPVERAIPAAGSLARAALEAMIQGPSPAEVAEGYTTAVPSTAEILGLTNEDGVVTVNLSAGSFPASSSPNAAYAWGQISRTLRQFPGVSAVTVRVEGVVVP